MRNWSIVAAAAALLMSGCAIHPVPEDVTGLKTSDIVKQIRCETRDAARKVILKFLGFMATQHDPAGEALLAKFEADPESMIQFNPDRDLPGDDRRIYRDAFKLIYSAGVAYSFDLAMTEDNNFKGTVNFIGPWNVAKVTLGITPELNRQRKNERLFTITDRLGFLLVELNTPNSRQKHYCDGHVNLGPNYIYPIAGRIGMYNTVDTFFQLTFFDGLASADAKKGNPFASGAPVMTDDLTFTTLIDVSATPSVTFLPAPKSGFQVSDANATGVLSRKDAHEVTVAIALNPSDKAIVAALNSLKGFVFSGPALGGPRVAVASPGGGTLLMLNRVTATATTPAQQLAVWAIDQAKSREVQLRPAPQ